MKLLALISGASFLVVGTLVGARMLLLARRTRGLPELLLGAGLSSLTCVTLPALVLALAVRPGGPGLQLGLFVLGLTPVVGFAVSLYAFTALVFHPASRAARAPAVVAGLLAAVGMAGIVSSRVAAWGADRVVGAPWAVLVIAVFVAGLVWTGLESQRYHRMLRRRLALGLADPVVCNRFFLWAFGSLGAVAGTLVVVASLLLGWRVVVHPVPILGVSFAGFALSTSWYLAFLPPRSYLQRVSRRSAAPR